MGWGGDGGGEQCDVGLGRRVAHGSVRLVGEQCGLGTGSDRSVAPPVMVLVSCAFRVRFACVRVMRVCLECACVVEMSVKGFRSICPSCFSCEWHGLIRVL